MGPRRPENLEGQTNFFGEGEGESETPIVPVIAEKTVTVKEELPHTPTEALEMAEDSVFVDSLDKYNDRVTLLTFLIKWVPQIDRLMQSSGSDTVAGIIRIIKDRTETPENLRALALGMVTLDAYYENQIAAEKRKLSEIDERRVDRAAAYQIKRIHDEVENLEAKRKEAIKQAETLTQIFDYLIDLSTDWRKVLDRRNNA